MSEKSKRVNSLTIKPKTEAPTIEGEIVVDSADSKVKAYLDSAERAVVTEDQEQTLTNKTHTDPILDGDLTGTAIDTDVTLAADSDTKVPSQKAIKAYVNSVADAQDDASEITYTPSTLTDWDLDADPGNIDSALDQLAERIDDEEIALSDHLSDATDAHDASAISNVPSGNLAATDLQGAVDELQSDIDTRALASDLTETDVNVDDLITLSGVAENATDLGTFTGTTITNNSTNKVALQELETAVELKADSSGLTETDANVDDLVTLSGVAENSTDLGTFTGATLSDNITVKAALQETETALETNATNLSDHLSDAVDAHDASAISNVPSGNLAATDQQSANDELQSDIDTRALADGGTITNASIQDPSRLDVKKDTEANLTTYASSATNGQFVFATDTKEMYQIVDNELTAVGGGGSTQFEINQAAHGFAVGDGIYHNGTSWVKGQSNDANTLAYQTVVAVADVDNFTAADFGRIQVSSHGFTVGEYYFLSDSVAGQPTITEPTSGFSNPLFYVESADILQIKCLRPTGTDAIELDQLADVSVPTPTDGQVLTYNTSNSRWESADSAADAADLTYTPTTLADWDSNTDPGNVDGALDQLAERVDDNEINITSNDTDIRDLQTKANINYAGDLDAEVDPDGWIDYSDAVAEIPEDGTGGSSNIIISRNTSSPLRGVADLSIFKDAVNRQGQGAGGAFTIDNADQAKKLTISFDYTTSIDYVDGDIKVFVYDITNANLIRVNGEDLKANAGNATHVAQFQTAPDSTSYRLILHVSSTNAAAYTINLDNVRIGPREQAFGAFITDWEDFTPLSTWTSGVTINAKYRRVGGVAQIRYILDITGTPTSSSLELGLPSGLNLDTNILLDSTSFATEILGSGAWRDTGTASGNVYGFYRNTSTYPVSVAFADDSISGTNPIRLASVTQSDPHSWTSSDYLTLNIEVPIQGWSSNAVSSEDLGGREIAERYTQVSQTITASTRTTLIYDTPDANNKTSFYDTTTGIFTTPETGWYDIDATVTYPALNISGGGDQAQIEIQVDGVLKKVVAEEFEAANSAKRYAAHLSDSYYLVKGQELEISTFQVSDDASEATSSVSYDNTFSIAKRSSPQTILETETVAARYTTSSGQAIPHNSVVVVEFENLIEDTHNAYNTTTGVYTAPANGWYLVTSGIRYTNATYSAGTSFELQIRIDGARVDSDTYETEATTNSRISLGVSRLIPLNRGQEVTIESYQNEGSPQNLDTDGTRNTFSIARIK